MREVWVAGFPSTYGGADTELDHLIDLLRRRDVAVTLVPMFSSEARMVESVRARGCQVVKYDDAIFRDRVVVSFCNGELLARLPRIMVRGRPKRVVWFNCMTTLFDGEKRAHAEGWIDYFGFVSEYQRRLLGPELEKIRPYRAFAYKPFFNVERVEWRPRAPDDCYKIGRISRDDASKFAPDTWRIFERVLVPAGVKKKIYILGHGPNAATKIGPPPPGLDWLTWSANAIPSTEFYRTIDTMIHKTGGSRESYCRVLIEAYAHGVVPVVENDYAFPELMVHGETGFATNDSDEMSFYASLLAHRPDERRRLAENGRRHLEQNLVNADECWRGWLDVL